MSLGKKVKFKGVNLDQGYIAVNRMFITPMGRGDGKPWNVNIRFDLYGSEQAYIDGEPCLNDQSYVQINIKIDSIDAFSMKDLFAQCKEMPEFEGCVDIQDSFKYVSHE